MVPRMTQLAHSGRRQQERSRVTRLGLLAAAIECVAELGWAGATMAVIAERAGVSRGASQHHFPTRDELLTAAVEHVGRARIEEIRHRGSRLPKGKRRTEAILALLASFYMDSLFAAALQVWTAAVSEPRLRTQAIALETRVNREVHRLAVELLGVDEAAPGVRETVQATIDLIRGLALANLLRDDGPRRRKVLRQWARILDDTFSR